MLSAFSISLLLSVRIFSFLFFFRRAIVSKQPPSSFNVQRNDIGKAVYRTTISRHMQKNVDPKPFLS